MACSFGVIILIIIIIILIIINNDNDDKSIDYINDNYYAGF